MKYIDEQTRVFDECVRKRIIRKTSKKSEYRVWRFNVQRNILHSLRALFR
ncbi:hypothetical protein WH47_07179 [Habropoda laboriosa]|uniref:Uncharacterized protein n=1 Tax=Habropoda laboriosa TaxID=597456 RepID=A0A0L7QQU8_9HYME|nr:hypothetical protein WH47_07179 [Habropoda laboriosa]